MKSFKIPIVPATTSINQAFMTAIDAAASGVLVKAGGDLRLVHYRDLVNAASKGRRLVSKANYESVLKLGSGRVSLKQKGKVEAAGLKFGYFTASGGTARMFSVSERFADLYGRESDGARCKRPNKPPAKEDQEWYHYYPPTDRLPGTPNICRVCGAAVP
jgi:hypothetical protein